MMIDDGSDERTDILLCNDDLAVAVGDSLVTNTDDWTTLMLEIDIIICCHFDTTVLCKYK